MFTRTKSLLVAALVLVGLAGMGFNGRPRAGAEPHAAPAAAGQRRGIDPATAVALVETDRYRLFYPVAFNDTVALLDVLKHVETAMDRVEGEMGPFKKKVEIYVPAKIEDANAAALHLVIAGLTWEEKKQVYVLVALWSADKVDTFAHELLHARLRDANLHPPHWFEEGLAHFVESEDGFNQELFDILEKEGPLTVKEANAVKGMTHDEMRLRATAWAIVYYLNKVKGESLKKIAVEKHLPDSDTVMTAIRKARMAPRTAH